MSYKVHRFDIRMDEDQRKLEHFLNSLEGDVVSIIPNIANTTLFQIYGVSRKIKYLLIVERVKE